ncbi:hypothetical protein DB31_7803 [Hyalangium minutum]|uniref:Tetratricopeptide repeat protein n=1 Tax=Hyalangium minutum TaxID=394096 RepID=A0A085WLK3_9BACT|nr:hypothetical protein DB31_7803 [Hyalangium minutum]
MCLLAVGLIPGVVWAQDDFHRYFSEAVKLYNRGENEQALEQFQQAKARTYVVQQDVVVALYEGLILLELGPKEKALAALETGLLLDPDAELPVMVSPKVKEEFEALREKVRKKLARRESAKAEDMPTRAKLDPTEASKQKLFEPRSGLAQQSRMRVPAVPLALAGVGVVAAGVGAVLGNLSNTNAHKANDAYKNGRNRSRVWKLVEGEAGRARADMRGRAWSVLPTG